MRISDSKGGHCAYRGLSTTIRPPLDGFKERGRQLGFDPRAFTRTNFRYITPGVMDSERAV